VLSCCLALVSTTFSDYLLSSIEPPALRRKAATDKLVEKIIKHDSWPIQPDILSPPLLRLTSRKPLWLDLQPADIKTRLRHNWKSAQVVSVVSTEPFPHGTGTLWCLHLVPCVVELVGSCIPIHAHAWIGSCTCMNRDAGSYQLSHTWDQVISWSHAPRGVNNQDVIKMSDGHRNVVIR